MLIDSHAHLEFDNYQNDLDKVIMRAQDVGVEKIVTLGVNMTRAAQAVAIAQKYEGIYAAIGIHPDDTKKTDLSEAIRTFEEMLIPENKVVAIGETGIDYYRTAPEDLEVERKTQEAFFRAHIELAREHSLPLIIHLRGDRALEHALGIVTNYVPLSGVVHCFGGNVKEAEKFIEKGLHISFTGIVTFKNALDMQEVAKNIPLEKILIETDSPYLTPDPFRGKRNEPAYVKYVAEKIAEIRGIPFKEVEEATTRNAEILFSI